MAIADHAAGRGGEQDGAAARLAQHVPRGELADIEGAEEVHPQHALELGALDVDELVPDRDPGVGDGHIQAAEALERAPEGGVHRRGIGHIGQDHIGEPRQPRPDRRRPPLVAAPGRDPRAVGDEALGDRRADPGGSARDDRALAVQIGHGPAPLSA